MKRACEQCEKVEPEPVVGWLSLDWTDHSFQTIGCARLPVAFCSGECCIAWLSAAPHRGNGASIAHLRIET